jgi:hypothetical protein
LLSSWLILPLAFQLAQLNRRLTSKKGFEQEQDRGNGDEKIIGGQKGHFSLLPRFSSCLIFKRKLI